MGLGVWGCAESFFFFFFTDGLKEQPSLMDYFQLRIQVSHPASFVIENSVRTAPEPFGLQTVRSIHTLRKDLYLAVFF